MKNEGLVSVIIRTKNRPFFLQRAIESVCSQTYENIEIVVVNDGGSDVSNIVKHYESLFSENKQLKRKFIYIINNISKMRAGAANIGMEASHGDYLCLLDDDDYFYSNHIMDHVMFQNKSRSLWSVSKSFEVLEDENGNERLKKYNFPRQVSKLKFYFFENYFPSNSIIFQRELFIKVGGFDTKLRVLEDWDLWIRMFMESEPGYIDKITCVYTSRNGGSNVRLSFESKNTWKESFKQVMEKYKLVYNVDKVNIPLSEVDSFLSKQAVEWYHLTKENDELKSSIAYKLYNSQIYRNFKKIGRFFKSTRG